MTWGVSNCEFLPIHTILDRKFQTLHLTHASMVMKNNKGYRKKELVKTLNDTLTAKKNGAKCMICGAPIWAAGSAITGSNLCFTCTTGEANDSGDYEIE